MSFYYRCNLTIIYIYIYINKTIISACDKENIIKFNNIYIYIYNILKNIGSPLSICLTSFYGNKFKGPYDFKEIKVYSNIYIYIYTNLYMKR